MNNTVELCAQGSIVRLEATDAEWHVTDSLYSAGYGLVETCKAIRLPFTSQQIEWRILMGDQ